LIELRAADLRFASGEVAAFFNEVMGLALSTEDIAALETRTEGWAAGLQVVALSLQGRGETSHFIRAFTGSNRYILDYLTEEVLQRQPEDVQSFLLRTAVLDRLTGPLCDALTGQGEARSC
jgi:LuxR family maltose regulon positive regulatory protein